MVQIILMDCDGVLTDGTYLYSQEGKVYKVFSAIDSKGITRAKKKGIYFAVISEDPTGFDINKARCKDLNIDYYKAANSKDKLNITEKLVAVKNCTIEDVAYIGDDIGDLHVLKSVGFPTAVSNATPPVKLLVEKRGGYISNLQGGKGVVREIIEYFLDMK